MATKRARKPKTWETYLKAQARRIWGWSLERKEVKRRAAVPGGMFRCESCNDSPLKRTEVEIDHVESVENVGVWDGWDNWLNRLFCPAEGLALICKACHTKKTNKDSAERRAARKAPKPLKEETTQ